MKTYETKIHRYEADQMTEQRKDMQVMGLDGWTLCSACPIVEPGPNGSQLFRMYVSWQREISEPEGDKA